MTYGFDLKINDNKQKKKIKINDNNLTFSENLVFKLIHCEFLYLF